MIRSSDCRNGHLTNPALAGNRHGPAASYTTAWDTIDLGPRDKARPDVPLGSILKKNESNRTARAMATSSPYSMRCKTQKFGLSMHPSPHSTGRGKAG